MNEPNQHPKELGVWGYVTNKPCYQNTCKICDGLFLAISKHLPVCIPCGGNPEYVYSNEVEHKPKP